MSYILCFLNLQSKSYNIPEDKREPTIGTRSLSTDEPVSTLFTKDERGTVVLQHTLQGFMVALGGTAVHKGSSSSVIKISTSKAGLFHSVEYCIIPKFCPLEIQKVKFLWLTQILEGEVVIESSLSAEVFCTNGMDL